MLIQIMFLVVAAIENVTISMPCDSLIPWDYTLKNPSQNYSLYHMWQGSSVEN